MKTKNYESQAMGDARRRLGMSQLDLGRRGSCTESKVTKIETGRATSAEWLKEAISHEPSSATWEVAV